MFKDVVLMQVLDQSHIGKLWLNLYGLELGRHFDAGKVYCQPVSQWLGAVRIGFS